MNARIHREKLSMNTSFNGYDLNLVKVLLKSGRQIHLKKISNGITFAIFTDNRKIKTYNFNLNINK